MAYRLSDVAQERIGAGIHGDQRVVHFPFWLEPTLRQIRSAPVRERPHEPLVLRPVLGHNHFEHPPSSSRVEVRRLALIAIPEIEAVLGAERDIDLLFAIPVAVAKLHREGPIGISLPPVKRGTYILSPGICDSGNWNLSALS